MSPAVSPAPNDTDAFRFHAAARAKDFGAAGLRGLFALQMARALFRLGFSGTAALLVGRLVMGETPGAALPAGIAALLAASILAGLAADRFQATAEASVAMAMRDAAARQLAAMPARQAQGLSAGTAAMSMQRHPEAVAALAIGHRAASMMMGVGPLMAAGALLFASWQAALLVLGLTPVMILFFALVGDAIRRRADAQERAFGRLAGQFADRLRTLPTILANHALKSEQAKLRVRLEAHAERTMGVLRIAFVNAGIIDFFASLSIATLAVFLGLGHLRLAIIPGFSDLQLWQSLFILMIAPDYFAPFRRFSEQYHAKAEGQAAAGALDRLLDGTPVAEPMPALAVPADLPRRGLVALVGPSGSGKTTLLRRMAGIDGEAAVAAPDGFAWISTDAFVPGGTLRQAIAWNAGTAYETHLRLAAQGAGLLDAALLPGGLDAPVEPGGANLSGGQRLRIALARANLSARPVIADEPTAKLDAETALAIRQMLVAMARDRLVVVATHDRALAALAERVIVLGETATVEEAA